MKKTSLFCNVQTVDGIWNAQTNTPLPSLLHPHNLIGYESVVWIGPIHFVFCPIYRLCANTHINKLKTDLQ